MNKNRAIITFFILILTIIAVTAASCITIVEKSKPGDKPGISAPPTGLSGSGAPVIKSFIAGQTSVNAGQQVQLTWEVSGSQKVEISPTVGAVDAVSAALVSPPATTTYTLTATNAAGSTVANVTITIAAGAANRADLVITDIQLITRDVYYKTKNSGAAESKGCRANLYVNGIKQADDYIEILAPGQERLSNFSNYSFPYLVGDLPQTQFYELMRQFTIKVCADVENVVVESDESNNCKSVIWGQKFVYNFVNFSHQARWTTGYGVLKLPLPEESSTGSARVEYQTLEDNLGYGAALLTVPQQVNDGWIQGEFGEFYTDELRQTRVREITMPDMAIFSAKVGFSSGTPPGSQARFMFGTVDQSGRVTFAPAITASMDGKLQACEVDLSSVAGQKRMFILRVEVIGPTAKVRPVWVDPKIGQP